MKIPGTVITLNSCLHYHVLGKLHVALVVDFDDGLGKFTYFLRSRENLLQI